MLRSDESTLQVVLGNNGPRVLRAKEVSKASQVQKPVSVVVWDCACAIGVSNLYICESTINVEGYICISEQHMLLSRHFFFFFSGKIGREHV